MSDAPAEDPVLALDQFEATELVCTLCQTVVAPTVHIGARFPLVVLIEFARSHECKTLRDGAT